MICFYLRTTAGEEQSGKFGSLALLPPNTLLAEAIFKLSNVEIDRDTATLHPIIEKCTRPGTEVHTDDWGAYRNLDQRLNNVARHRVVNHSRYFVDPRTGIHTQEAESCWATLKLKQVIKRGIRRKDMQSYLDDKMWRQWRGGPRQQIMSNFLHALAAQFDNFSVF